MARAPANTHTATTIRVSQARRCWRFVSACPGCRRRARRTAPASTAEATAPKTNGSNAMRPHTWYSALVDV